MNTNSLPITLSQAATKILKEVELLYKSEVWWQETPGLEGDMCALRNTPMPTVRYKNTSVLNEGGIVHELLHLKLRRLGYPNVQKADPQENNNWRDQTVAMLNNLFEHALIFPELERLGYFPFEAEENGTRAQLTRILSSDFPSPDSNPSLTSLSALLYARAYLDCRSQAVRALCESIFSQPSFASSKFLGQKVIEAVHNDANNDVSQFRSGLNECVRILNEQAFIQLEATNGA